MAVAASLRFAAAARVLSVEAQRRGLAAPGFRSPPRRPGTDRTVRRRPDGLAVVAVRVRGRPFTAVAADMVEGVLVANGVSGSAATPARTALLAAVLQDATVRAA
ncbi:MAG: hypothetical protein ABR511_14980 [Acidimicrobiales bacterium]